MTHAPRILALAIGLAVAGLAIAQTPPTPAQRDELDAARAQLDQAAQRYAELSRKYGGGDAPLRIEKRVLRKPVLGVVLAKDDQSGVRIAAVTPGSAAAEAGLETGDRITSVDGKRVDAGAGDARVEQARALLATLDARTPVRLGYERDGKPATLSLTPKVDDRVMVMQGPGGTAFDGDVQVFVGDDGGMRRIDADRIRLEAGAARAHAVEARARAAGERDRAEWVMVAPDVRTEVIRLGSDCKGDDCKLPALAEAFRWNGLNLASVDAGLGRYFGASKGVLVLSTGKELDGLQAGDVIRSVGGKDVATPREAMDALRAQPAGGKVAIGYLRDRTPATTHVNVPKAMTFALPRVAPAPRMPGEPGAIERKRVFVGTDGRVQTFEDGDGLAPRASPEDAPRVEKRRYVMVDKDGKRMEWEGDAGEPAPAWVQALPKDASQRQVRKIVMVDADGKATELETGSDDLPPPPPPAPPAPPVPRSR